MAESGETTIVGADSHFKGELTFERTARIIGRFDGKIMGKGELQVNQNAECKADLEVAGAQIDGTVEGNVNAKDTVRLNTNGVIRGDITAAKMTMAEGASFFGMCAVGAEAQQRVAGQTQQRSAGDQQGQSGGGEQGQGKK